MEAIDSVLMGRGQSATRLLQNGGLQKLCEIGQTQFGPAVGNTCPPGEHGPGLPEFRVRSDSSGHRIASFTLGVKDSRLLEFIDKVLG